MQELRLVICSILAGENDKTGVPWMKTDKEGENIGQDCGQRKFSIEDHACYSIPQTFSTLVLLLHLQGCAC